MSKYEVIFIVDARSSDGEKAEVAKQVTDLTAKVGGQVLACDIWIDRQRMAFPLKKAWEGTYYKMDAEIPELEVARFRKELLINERILRFLIVAVEPEKAVA